MSDTQDPTQQVADLPSSHWIELLVTTDDFGPLADFAQERASYYAGDERPGAEEIERQWSDVAAGARYAAEKVEPKLVPVTWVDCRKAKP